MGRNAVGQERERPLAAAWPVLALAASVALLASCALGGVGMGQPSRAQEQLSAGCGARPPAAPPSAVTVDGRERPLIAAVPDHYDPNRPHSLVVAFHGRTNSNAQVRRYYDLEEHAGGATIFVYPSGLPQGDGTYGWSDPGDPAGALRDYALFDVVLETFGARYCLDLDRVFVVGHSLGAWFVNSLACARGDRIRGAGVLGGGVSLSDCTGPVAAIVLHNPDDRLVAISHGLEVRDSYLARNGLDGAPRPTDPRELNCVRYGPPRAANPVVWCPHEKDRTRTGRYYPHNWPQGTGEAIMGFFGALP